MKEKKGISLIVTVITIIIMIIIAGAVIISLTNTNIIDQADTATTKYNKQQYKQIIGNEFAILRTSEKAKGKTTRELFEMLEEQMNMKELTWTATSKVAYINVNDEYFLTLLEDGTIKEGKIAILDIADGSIQLKENGYIQGTNPLIEYAGDYIITGTTSENAVKVMEQGIYNIIIKDLNIDVSSMSGIAAIDANYGQKQEGNFTNIYIEGTNTLYAGKSRAGIQFVKAKPNVEGVTNGSTLTIQGNGNLYVKGGSMSAGIGGGYQNGDVCNIIINSGNITASASGGAAIGGGLRSNVNNLIINGGNIITEYTNNGGIGTRANMEGHGNLENLIINGGNITAYGGEYGAAIGATINSNVGEVKITGGVLTLTNNGDTRYTQNSALGHGCNNIEISGGTIICNTKYKVGIGTINKENMLQNIKMTGGSICINSAEDTVAVQPLSGENNVYLTQIQLQNITEETLVTSFTTSDNLTYGIKDMYTNEDGKLFVYLPIGERTINITAGGKEYTGTVVTGNTDSTECTVLNVK